MLVHGASADATGFDAEIRALQRGRLSARSGSPTPSRPRRQLSYLAEFLRTLGAARSSSWATSTAATSSRPPRPGQRPGQGARRRLDVRRGREQADSSERFEGSLVGPRSGPCPTPARTAARTRTSSSPPRRSGRPSPPTSTRPRRTSWPLPSGRTPPPRSPARLRPRRRGRHGPCWYLLGTEDKAIPPALQRFMAERANATIVEVPASHVSFVSQPDAATQLILQAVAATTPTASPT